MHLLSLFLPLILLQPIYYVQAGCRPVGDRSCTTRCSVRATICTIEDKDKPKPCPVGQYLQEVRQFSDDVCTFGDICGTLGDGTYVWLTCSYKYNRVHSLFS